jgi:hypothetical protein
MDIMLRRSWARSPPEGNVAGYLGVWSNEWAAGFIH